MLEGARSPWEAEQAETALKGALQSFREIQTTIAATPAPGPP